jgi:hypothetical protein
MEQNEPLRAVGPCSAGPIAATIHFEPSSPVAPRRCRRRTGRRVNDGRKLTPWRHAGVTPMGRPPGRSRRRSKGKCRGSGGRVATAVGGTAVEQQDGDATAVTVDQDVGRVGRASAAADVGAAAAATIGAAAPQGHQTLPVHQSAAQQRPEEGRGVCGVGDDRLLALEGGPGRGVGEGAVGGDAVALGVRPGDRPCGS